MSTKKSPNKTCFFVSPIGKEGTEQYTKSKEVLDFIVKPAIEKADLDYHVIRADDITKSGSFVKDIIEQLNSAYIVIADLTGQNPNVFYELGVRHALSSRTIIIAQSIDDIPSDLRSYRTIIYETSAKGAKQFADKIEELLKAINNDPEASDNPVLDFIPELKNSTIQSLEEENRQLKNDLEKSLKQPQVKPPKIESPAFNERIKRVFALNGAEIQDSSYPAEASIQQTHKDGKKTTYKLPKKQGAFSLFFVLENESILDFWYFAKKSETKPIDDYLADIRVLLTLCCKKQPCKPTFIIAADQNLGDKKEEIQGTFKKMLGFIPASERNRFDLLLWDQDGLKEVEKKVGLVIK